MLARLTSLRFWLVVAMIGTAVVGLAGAYLSYGKIQESRERSVHRAKAKSQAAAVAAEAAAGAGRLQLAELQAVLPNNQLIVVRHGRRVFAGPPISGREFEVGVSAPFPGGRVILRDYEPAARSSSLVLTLVAGGVILLVILAAVVVATLVTRAVREPVARAVAAADRLAGGDFSARMGASGPDELVRLGTAFDSMAARLEAADRDQRRFLADVAHEIATPTTAISGYGLALADGSLRTNEERAEAKALIESETRRLNGMIEDLRELTRLDLAQEVRRAHVDLGALFRTAGVRFLPAARAGGVTLNVDAEPIIVDADERLLAMVVHNLLSNAIRYTPRGGQIDLQLRHRRDEIILAVRDTGIGIAPEHQQRVFDRLYRVGAARDRASGGSGLGLAIAQRAAHGLGGRIELESEPGLGSEFRLVLPGSTRWRRAARSTPKESRTSPTAS